MSLISSRSGRVRVARLVAAVAVALSAGAGIIATAGPAAAACPISNPDCGGPPEPVPHPDTAAFTWALAHIGVRANGAAAAKNLDFALEPAQSPVDLNACTSYAAAGIVSYQWTFDSGYPPITTTSCDTTWNRNLSEADQAVTVTLRVVTRRGATLTVSPVVHYRDRRCPRHQPVRVRHRALLLPVRLRRHRAGRAARAAGPGSQRLRALLVPGLLRRVHLLTGQ